MGFKDSESLGDDAYWAMYHPVDHNESGSQMRPEPGVGYCALQVPISNAG